MALLHRTVFQWWFIPTDYFFHTFLVLHIHYQICNAAPLSFNSYTLLFCINIQQEKIVFHLPVIMMMRLSPTEKKQIQGIREPCSFELLLQGSQFNILFCTVIILPSFLFSFTFSQWSIHYQGNAFFFCWTLKMSKTELSYH